MNTRTVKAYKTVHGTDPQKLVEKIIRERIYDCAYYKERCNTLDFHTIQKLAEELAFVGGIYSNTKPVPFLCLVQKLLQIQPDDDIVERTLCTSTSKYVVALFAFYTRLVCSSELVYRRLEPLLDDYRRLRFRGKSGSYELTTLDQFVDELLVKDRVCDIILPRLTKRTVLEKSGVLAPLNIPELEAEPPEQQPEVKAAGAKLRLKEPRAEAPAEKGKESMSIAETNVLRAQLGLKPLKD